MSDNARLIARISDPEFHISSNELSSLSRRLAEKVRSPLVQPWGLDGGGPLLSIIDPKREPDPEYVMRIASPKSQLMEVSVYGRYWSAWPGFRLLAEWLKHHLACEVFLGSSYGLPWMPFDPPTIARNDDSFIRMFCQDTRGSSYTGLPSPKNISTGIPALIAARFGANRFDPAIKSLIDILGHHRQFQGQIPIQQGGPPMMVFDVQPGGQMHDDTSIWRPIYRSDDPAFAIPRAHRFAVIQTTLPLADTEHDDAWPLTRFLLEVLALGLGGEPVYGAASEADRDSRPRLLSSEDIAARTRAYLRFSVGRKSRRQDEQSASAV